MKRSRAPRTLLPELYRRRIHPSRGLAPLKTFPRQSDLDPTAIDPVRPTKSNHLRYLFARPFAIHAATSKQATPSLPHPATVPEEHARDESLRRKDQLAWH